MKNIYDVIRQKEAEIGQLQKEIEALRLAARLLTEESDLRAEGVGRLPGVTSGPVAAPPLAASAVSSPPLSASGRPVAPVLTKEGPSGWEGGSRQFP